jgi:hypothetical protein
LVPVGGGEYKKRMLEAEYCKNVHVEMYENGKMRPV